MVTEAVEVERKYDSDGVANPPLDGLPGVARVAGPERFTLEAIYFDTDDLRLARAAVTLRRRSGGHDAGWHLKLPGASPSERVELRLPLGDDGEAVPERLVDLTLSRTRGAPLRPIATLQTQRAQWRLLDSGGEALAEVVADDVSARDLGAAQAPVEWHEMEVELLGGAQSLLDAVEARLGEFGARPSDSPSKLRRLLGDRLPAVPREREDEPSTAAAVALAYLRAQVDAIVSYDPKVRRDDPDAVHKMRVAARRARSTLQAFRSVLDRSSTAELISELRWLGTVLAGPRELHVQRRRLLEQLRALPPELLVGPIVSRVESHFEQRSVQGREAMLDELRGQRYLALLEALQRLLAHPPLTDQASAPAHDTVTSDIRRAQRRTRRAMKRYLDDPEGPGRDAALHEARKAAKRARYAAEAASPALGKPARRRAKRLKTVQGVLGDHQDIITARPVLRELGMHAHLGGENAFSYGLLLGQDVARAEHLRAQLPRLWKRADAGKL